MVPSAISSRAVGDIGQPSSGTAIRNGQLDGIRLRTPSTDGPSNSSTNGHDQRPPAQASPTDDVLDLICIGFGPASLAIAVALHDATINSKSSVSSASSVPPPPLPRKVLFIEKQPRFAWHAGMQLPGAKMQISFLKDLATPRDPTSRFTFLNYLFENGRLNHFINLGTFLPTRIEYEDYLRWCAGHFEKEGKVVYGMEVESVRIGEMSEQGKVVSFEIAARTQEGRVVTKRARNVVIAVGGRPIIPAHLQDLKHVVHSSQSASVIRRIQESEEAKERPLRFAVIGGGQSAAEIFNDLGERFPNARVSLVIKGPSLRPSDDSPFVNEIFDPGRVDAIYNQDPYTRAASIAQDRNTNYGVVRLGLLEHLYEMLYLQRLQNPDETQWRCRIIPHRTVVSAQQQQPSSSSDSSAGSTLKLKLGLPGDDKEEGSRSRVRSSSPRRSDPDLPPPLEGSREEGEGETLEVDYLFAATGYRRNAHEEILAGLKELIPHDDTAGGGDGLVAKVPPVGRDYKVLYDERKVDERAGIWLQGCNEVTHGLSDTLLSILAVRAGDLVKSMFGS